jgi:hypothetical protein
MNLALAPPEVGKRGIARNLTLTSNNYSGVIPALVEKTSDFGKKSRHRPNVDTRFDASASFPPMSEKASQESLYLCDVNLSSHFEKSEIPQSLR